LVRVQNILSQFEMKFWIGIYINLF